VHGLIYIIVIAAMVISGLRRGRGAGPPIDRRWMKLPLPRPSSGSSTTGPSPPEQASASSRTTREAARRTDAIRERIERARTETRRRKEIEAANAAAEAAVGPRTDVPGGIDPRLLDAGRTPPPTPDPIHPR
jgi:hypothetical protein